jgi:hypothetical protein
MVGTDSSGGSVQTGRSRRRARQHRVTPATRLCRHGTKIAVASVATPASSQLLGRWYVMRYAPFAFSIAQCAIPAGILLTAVANQGCAGRSR